MDCSPPLSPLLGYREREKQLRQDGGCWNIFKCAICLTKTNNLNYLCIASSVWLVLDRGHQKGGVHCNARVDNANQQREGSGKVPRGKGAGNATQSAWSHDQVNLSASGISEKVSLG